MRVFASKEAAGQELAPLVQAAVTGCESVVVLGVDPGGLPVARMVADALGLQVHPVSLVEGPQGLTVGPLPDLADQAVIVVDDGVETGTAAKAIAAALEPLGADRRVLAVPVCPHQALATLQLAYDEVIAIARPLARRSLRWHYADGSTSTGTGTASQPSDGGAEQRASTSDRIFDD